jgi:hypothetical protein
MKARWSCGVNHELCIAWASAGSTLDLDGEDIYARVKRGFVITGDSRRGSGGGGLA